MKYYVTINNSRQDKNFGTGKSPEFANLQTAWVFEAENESQIFDSAFTIKSELHPFDTKEKALDYAKNNADNRFIEFAPFDLLRKMNKK